MNKSSLRIKKEKIRGSSARSSTKRTWFAYGICIASWTHSTGNEENPVKTFALLVCILALAMSASAQQLNTDFSDLPTINMPIPMPADYPNNPFDSFLTWSNFNYFSPSLDPGLCPSPLSTSCPGFTLAPNTNFVFIGGPDCQAGNALCIGTLKMPVAPNATASFQPLTMTAASGWCSNNVIVMAYNKSSLLSPTLTGTNALQLTPTSPTTVNFPATWTTVTELRFYVLPDSLSCPYFPGVGSMVVFSFTANVNQ